MEEVQGSQGPGVPRSQSPKDQDISKSHSITSLTLKKVHLVSSSNSVEEHHHHDQGWLPWQGRCV